MMKAEPSGSEQPQMVEQGRGTRTVFREQETQPDGLGCCAKAMLEALAVGTCARGRKGDGFG